MFENNGHIHVYSPEAGEDNPPGVRIFFIDINLLSGMHDIPQRRINTIKLPRIRNFLIISKISFNKRYLLHINLFAIP